jgi:hypothetical protein
MTNEERVLRVIARGEHSNHSHVIVGEAIVEERDGATYITVENDGDASIKHLLETEWLQGNEVWTKEHADIELEKGEDKIRAVKD